MLAKALPRHTDVVEEWCHIRMSISIYFLANSKSPLIVLNRFLMLANAIPHHADVVEVYCYIRMPVAVQVLINRNSMF